MCCLIAALYNPSCTPGDVYLVFLGLLHAKKKRGKKGRNFSYQRGLLVVKMKISDITNCYNLGGFLMSHFPTFSMSLVSADEEDVASSPVTYWMVLVVVDGCFNTLIGYMWKDLFQNDTSIVWRNEMVFSSNSDWGQMWTLILIGRSENRLKSCFVFSQKQMKDLFLLQMDVSWFGIDFFPTTISLISLSGG